MAITTRKVERRNNRLSDCGCGGQRQLSGLSNQQANEIQKYIDHLQGKLSQPNISPSYRQELEAEKAKYEAELRKALGNNSGGMSGGGNGGSDEKNFLTRDDVISGVPNWAVGGGAILLAYIAYQAAT